MLKVLCWPHNPQPCLDAKPLSLLWLKWSWTKFSPQTGHFKISKNATRTAKNGSREEDGFQIKTVPLPHCFFKCGQKHCRTMVRCRETQRQIYDVFLLVLVVVVIVVVVVVVVVNSSSSSSSNCRCCRCGCCCCTCSCICSCDCNCNCNCICDCSCNYTYNCNQNCHRNRDSNS